MAQAKRDLNYVPSLIGVSNADGETTLPVYVDPATNRLLVNAVLSGGAASDGAIVDGVSSSIKATVFDYTNSNPLAVVLRDTNGDYVSVGGGTQYTEDAAAAANPVGNAVNLIRQDTPATLVSTDGDNVAQRGTNYGAAYVQLVTSAGAFIDSVGGGTQYAVDAALGANPTGTLAIAIRDDALSALTPVEGDAIGLRVNSTGALWVEVSASALPTGAATAALQSTGNGHLFTIADSMQTEDAAHSSGAKGVMSLAIRNDTRGTLSDASGDYTPLQVNSSGDLRVDGSAVTQPISAASLPLPTGAATSANQSTANTHLATIAGAVSGTEMQVDVLTMPTVTVQATNLDIRDLAKASDSVTAAIENIHEADFDTGAGTDTTPAIGIAVAANGGAAVITGDTANGLDVDVTRVGGNVTVINAGTFAVQESGAALTALQKIDNIAHSGSDVALSEHVPISGQLDDASTTTVTENQVAPVRITSARALHVQAQANSGVDIGDVTINNASGASAVNIQDGGNSITVDNGGTFATQVDGAALTALQLIDDPVFADDAGFTLGTHKGGVLAGIAVQTDGTDPTAVSAEADVAALRTDMQRNLIVNQTHPRFWHVSADYAAAQTNTSVKAAPGASLSLYITDIMISNGATAGNVTLLDGSGGTVLYEIYPAINGGVSQQLRSPIKLTANTALCITSTTVTTHSIFVSGYIGP